MRFLLEKGCNKKVLIHSSIVFNRKRCLEILLEYHADPNEFDAEGSTPLFLCLKHNLLEFAIILIHKGADPSILVNNILIIKFSHQSLLYYAAIWKNTDFVDFLLSNKTIINDANREIVSPVSIFKPSIPPIFGSLKEDNYEMTCLFLLHGIDPNSLIPYDQFFSFISQYGQNINPNSESNFDSKKSKKSHSHGKRFVRPLDVALAMKKGRTVSTLIACGADVNVIDMENLKPSIKNQLQAYRDDSSRSDIYNLPERIRHLRKDIESYYIETEGQLDNMRNIDNFRAIEVSPLINRIRKHYSRSSQVLTSIQEIIQIISHKRNNLIKSQLELLAEDDKILRNAKKKFDNMQNEFKQQDKNKMPSQDIDQYDVSMSSLYATESDSSNDTQTNHRAELLYYNNRYSDFKDLMNTFYNDFNEFHSNSLFVVNKLIDIMNDYLITIQGISNDFLQRLGFSNDINEQIKEGNQKKVQIIQTTSNQLKEQKNIFIQLYIKIKNCILYNLY